MPVCIFSLLSLSAHLRSWIHQSASLRLKCGCITPPLVSFAFAPCILQSHGLPRVDPAFVSLVSLQRHGDDCASSLRLFTMRAGATATVGTFVALPLSFFTITGA